MHVHKILTLHTCAFLQEADKDLPKVQWEELDPHAARQTALQWPLLSQHYHHHTRPPALYQCLSRHLYWRWLRPALWQWRSHSYGTQQSLLLIPNTPDTAPLHITTLPPHSSSSSTSPVYFHSVLKDDIKHILNCCIHSCSKYFWNRSVNFVRRREWKILGFSLRSLMSLFIFMYQLGPAVLLCGECVCLLNRKQSQTAQF